MKAIKSYAALTIVSSITVDQFKRVKKFAPEALVLVEEVNNTKIPIFKVDYSKTSNVDPRLGITFDNADENKHLCVTKMLPEDMVDANKEAVLEMFASALKKLKLIETQVELALQANEALIAEVEDCVEIQH